MNKENCFELGHITKTFGLDGFLTVFLDSDIPEASYNIESVLLEIKGELIPFFIEDHKETSNAQKVNFLFETNEKLNLRFKDDFAFALGLPNGLR